MKKPSYVSHYLVLHDLINGIDVRAKSDIVFYLTSRVENIKCDLVNDGLEFIEDIKKETPYSYYKPYILYPSMGNIQKAKSLLQAYATKEVLAFLATKQQISNEVNREN